MGTPNCLLERRRIDVIVRRLKVNTVRGIKHFDAELGRQFLRDGEILLQAQVRVGEAGSDEGVATYATQGPGALGTNADLVSHSAICRPRLGIVNPPDVARRAGSRLRRAKLPARCL